MKVGFDNKKYVKIQSEKIRERFKLFDKLYLEIGGKLFDDSHAARVLPGFKNDAKINMFKNLKDDLEIIFCINARDIEKSKTRGESGITYELNLQDSVQAPVTQGQQLGTITYCLNGTQLATVSLVAETSVNKINLLTMTKSVLNNWFSLLRP